jgi:hypothetical protein
MASSKQLAALESLTGRVSAKVTKLTYAQKRALLYALGLKMTVFRKGDNPRFRIRCDFEGLQTGMDTSSFEVDDQQLEELRRERKQPKLMHYDPDNL